MYVWVAADPVAIANGSESPQFFSAVLALNLQGSLATLLFAECDCYLLAILHVVSFSIIITSP